MEAWQRKQTRSYSLLLPSRFQMTELDGGLGLPDELLVQIFLAEKSLCDDRHLLAALCLVNHRVRRIVLPWLYRAVGHFRSIRTVVDFFDVLSARPHLCALICELDLTHYLPVAYMNDERVLASIRASLQRMPNLKHLVIPNGYPTLILKDCAGRFELESLSCAFDCDATLESFFRSQRALTELQIYGFPKAFWMVCTCDVDRDILPRLQVVRATVSWLEKLVPSRPVHTVQVLDLARWEGGGATFLRSAAGPIKSLVIPRPCMLANWGVLSRTGAPVEDIVVTEMSTGSSVRTASRVARARGLTRRAVVPAERSLERARAEASVAYSTLPPGRAAVGGDERANVVPHSANVPQRRAYNAPTPHARARYERQRGQLAGCEHMAPGCGSGRVGCDEGLIASYVLPSLSELALTCVRRRTL
ncbi:hypothetical protein EXIGLDRAFT_458834 [Exidia glandulosa HHB12029]|uniref:Uncharacterized protein n=1 Tax=Exidia glandulosa HHB12029 TaxID=1314781 RepID=A0A165PPV0_EXIGL|nr:hypothetical protein EXIGLDRAFT_458834 [Exidia glandulosa HHB12029]